MLKEYYLAFDYDANQNQNYILISDAEAASDIKYSLSNFYERSHKLASYFVKENYKKKFGLQYDPLKMSLYKVYFMSHILPICQLLLAAKDLLDSEKCIVRISTDCSDIAENIAKHLNINKDLRIDKPYINLRRYMFFPKAIYRFLLYVINSTFVKQDKSIRSALVCFGSDRFISPYFSKSSIVYPIYNWSTKFSDEQYNNKVVRRKFISLFTLIGFIPNFVMLFFKGYKISNSFSVALEQSLTISTEVLLCLSLKRKYKQITHLIGMFDASSCIDAITWFVNNQEVKTVIVPHGIPFSFRSPCLSYGANVYCTWSEFHSKVLTRNKFLQEKCEIIVTGNPIYKKMHLHYVNNLNKKSKKVTILMLMGYISENYCRSTPDQSIYIERLISTVVNVRKLNPSINIIVRSRNKDKVYRIAQKFKQFIEISTQLDMPIEDDIIKSDIVITQTSNGMVEALIFGIKGIQVNLNQIYDWHTYMKNPNIERVDNLKDLTTALTSLIEKKRIKTPYLASSDKYNFYNCQHLPYKIK